MELEIILGIVATVLLIFLLLQISENKKMKKERAHFQEFFGVLDLAGYQNFMNFMAKEENAKFLSSDYTSSSRCLKSIFMESCFVKISSHEQLIKKIIEFSEFLKRFKDHRLKDDLNTLFFKALSESLEHMQSKQLSESALAEIKTIEDMLPVFERMSKIELFLFLTVQKSLGYLDFLDKAVTLIDDEKVHPSTIKLLRVYLLEQLAVHPTHSIVKKLESKTVPV